MSVEFGKIIMSAPPIPVCRRGGRGGRPTGEHTQTLIDMPVGSVVYFEIEHLVKVRGSLAHMKKHFANREYVRRTQDQAGVRFIGIWRTK